MSLNFKSLKVINIYSGVGAGKSTLAADIFSALKRLGKSVEIVHEYGKTLVHEETDMINNQIYIGAHQFNSLFRLVGKVDYAIMDMPLLSCSIKNKDWVPPSYYVMIKDLYDLFDNCDLWLNRSEVYDTKNRNHNANAALLSDKAAKNLLNKYKIQPYEIDYNEESVVEDAVNYVLSKHLILSNKNKK